MLLALKTEERPQAVERGALKLEKAGHGFSREPQQEPARPAPDLPRKTRVDLELPNRKMKNVCCFKSRYVCGNLLQQKQELIQYGTAQKARNCFPCAFPQVTKVWRRRGCATVHDNHKERKWTR